MKKKFYVLISACALIFGCLLFTGCPSVTGLHNQPSVRATFKFVGFGNVSGNYSIPGDFDGDDAWEKLNETIDVVMKNGAGVSTTEVTISSDWIKFSLVPVGDWSRPWFGKIKGNAADGDKDWNFYIGNGKYSLGDRAITILVDASSGTAVLSVIR